MIEVLIRELLFADAAALATHSELKLQRLVGGLADNQCQENWGSRTRDKLATRDKT